MEPIGIKRDNFATLFMVVEVRGVGMFGIFEGIEGLIKVTSTLFVTCCLFVPLGLWKLVEIVLWLINNVSVSLK